MGELRALDEGLADALADALAGREHSPLGEDEPIGAHQGVRAIIERARLEAVADLVELTPTARTAVLQLGSPDAIGPDLLGQLVTGSVLTAAEASALGAAAELYAVCDGHKTLVDTIRAVADAPRTEELARWTAAAWEAMLMDHASAIPPGSTAAATARVLARRLAVLFPAAALRGRMPARGEAAITAALATAAVLEERNPRRFGRRFDELELGDVTPGNLAAVAGAWALLDAMARGYPGQNLDTIFDERGDTFAVRAKLASIRVKLVTDAVDVGGGSGATIDVLRFDLTSAGIDLKDLGLVTVAEADRGRVLATLRTYQRVRNLTGDLDDMTVLLAAGFTSAHGIAGRPRDSFAEAVDLPPDRADQVWETARTTALDAALFVGGIIDQMQPGPRATAVPPSVGEGLAALDGYASLFGDQSFCDCSQCASILGPAAYFVDLMAFVDRHVRSQLAAHVEHPLDLRTRRPDLWALPLTCANTNDRVPTVELVTEILENELARRAVYTGSWTDRAAIEAVVYPPLAAQLDSFRQPFDLSVARLGPLLAAHGVKPAAIRQAIGGDENRRFMVELGLSPGAFNLIGSSLPSLAAVGQIYGLTFSLAPTGVAEVDAAVLASAMGLDRDELGAVTATWLVQNAGPVRIVPAKRTPESVQNDVEWVQGLTVAALDHMHRLTRMARALQWPATRIDRVLRAAPQQWTNLSLVMRARALTERFGTALTDDDLTALAGRLDAAALDRLFNPRSQVAADGAWPQPSRRFIHPGLRTWTSAPPDPAVARLVAGVGVGIPDLERLIRYLAPQLAQESSPGFDPDVFGDDARYFVLSVENLSLLVRHARTARLLGLGVADLIRVMRIAGVSGLDGIYTVHALVEIVDTWRASGRSLDELAVATGQQAAGVDPAAIAALMRTAASELVVIHDNLFAAALGMSEAASRDVLAENAMLFESRPDGGIWLAAGIDPETATIAVPLTALVPDGANRRLATTDELRTVLVAHSAGAVLIRGLATATRRTDGEVRQLLALANQWITPDVVGAVRGDGDPAALIALIAAVAPIEVATRGWDAQGLALLRSDPARFGPGSWTHPYPDATHPFAPWCSLDQAWSFAAYARLNRPEHASDLRAAIAGFDPLAARFNADVEPALARVLGTSPGVLIGLRGTILPPSAPLAIVQLGAAVALATQLGVDGDALIGTLSDDGAARARAADALAHSLEVRAAADAALARRAAEAYTALRERRRDALVETLLRSSLPRFADTNALSTYFLIDVDAGGCATTSRVIAATNSLQQYVQRISLNLEQDGRAVTDPEHVELSLTDRALAEWQWRRTYRVWEANRKVFLWPENYLEPSLRDDATPLFRQLENELMQGDLDEGAILSAYATYLRGIEQLASLSIAGAYHDVDGDHDVLHLVGVGTQDPPEFYYRSCTDLRASGRDPQRVARWSAWHPIEIAIPSREVSPVVHQGRLHLLWADVKTRATQRVENGSSNFIGYRHVISISSTSLLPDGKWTAPQALALPDRDVTPIFGAGRGVVFDPLTFGRARFDDIGTRLHPEPLDDYTLSGRSWRGIWPHVDDAGIWVYFRNFRASGLVDLYARRIILGTPVHAATSPPLLGTIGAGTVSCGIPHPTPWPVNVFANIAIHVDRSYRLRGELSAAEQSALANALAPTYAPPFGTGVAIGEVSRDTDRYAIPGSPEDGIFTTGRTSFVLQGSVTDDDRYVTRRFGSSAAFGLSRLLFEKGIDDVLGIARQLALAEDALPLTPAVGRVIDRSGTGTLDYAGPFGTYFREIWFHIPILVATSLQAQGRHADARRWFHRVFDPTATEVIDTTGVPEEDAERRRLDRVWRCRELRGLDLERVRAILTDGDALEQYRHDPFNPHAIARRRPTAYLKYVFRRYVENLLDWADQLFAQFSMETVDEARMLYQLVAELLGPRPQRLGDCGTAVPDPRDYQTIQPLLEAGSELLIEVENEVSARAAAIPAGAPSAPPLMASHARMARMRERATSHAPSGATVPSFAGGWKTARVASWAPAKGVSGGDGHLGMGGRVWEPAGSPVTATDGFPASLWAELGPVFCVPANRDLVRLWDRVDDRLWKIRHCLDLDGQRRELALLAPEIDPATRVTATALGLSLEDLVGDAARDVPPYRFSYLIERSKGYAAALSGFGAALLSALERRDGAALARLRNDQGLALARMTTRQRELDVQIAEESLAATARQQEAAQYRRDYYDALADENLKGAEIQEGLARRGSKAMHRAGAILYGAAAAARLVPQIGSLFAMTHGGIQVGASLEAWGYRASAAGRVLDVEAAGLAYEAGVQRRRESWLHQVELAEHELALLARQHKASELRVRMAQRSLAIHEESVAQLEDVLAFERDRFTSLALHTRLAAGLQRLYRSAYGHALALARLAERAYRFERGDDTAGLAASYWDAGQGGLLAGERLLSDLQGLERRFLETNHRELEIDQPFALSQIDPAALIALRETGECEFTVPEIAFETTYPGQWKRRLRSVRLTIPCVTGPYVNVGATLSLVESWVRPTPALGDSLVAVPPAHGLAIATSTAQNDGGVFEMSFRDERYLPFEGLGAVSRWHLTLPRIVRPFDYASMNDVILSLAYSARGDAALRERAEAPLSTEPGSILHHHATAPSVRILSLREDAAGTFARLIRSAPATPIGFDVTDRQLAPVFRGREIAVGPASLVLRVATDVIAGDPVLEIDGVAVTGFTPQPALGDLLAAPITGPLLDALRGAHTIAVIDADGLAPTAPPPDDVAAVDPDRLLDVLIAFELRLAP